MEGSILLWIQDYIRCGLLNPLWIWITSLGNVGFIWILMIIILLARSNTRKIGKVALISFLICVGITFVIKPWVARIRPFDSIPALIPLVQKPLDASFPSGHTSASFSVAWIIYSLYPNKKIGVAVMILAFCIAFSRLYVGVHYPTDVLAGFFIGTCISFLCIKIYRKREIGD